jgi:hypothetical protein
VIFVFVSSGTQEAEGRLSYLGRFGSERQADDFIKEQADASQGWYSIHSYIKAKQMGR